MSQNRNQDDAIRSTTSGTGTTGTRATGGAGTGATDAGTTRDTSLATTTGAGGGSDASGGGAAGAAQGLTAQAQQYGQKVADAATQAKDFVTDKFKNLQNTDYKQVAEDARDYARQKPGQALLISAAAGFLIGLLIRSGSRR